MGRPAPTRLAVAGQRRDFGRLVRLQASGSSSATAWGVCTGALQRSARRRDPGLLRDLLALSVRQSIAFDWNDAALVAAISRHGRTQRHLSGRQIL